MAPLCRLLFLLSVAFHGHFNAIGEERLADGRDRVESRLSRRNAATIKSPVALEALTKDENVLAALKKIPLDALAAVASAISKSAAITASNSKKSNIVKHSENLNSDASSNKSLKDAPVEKKASIRGNDSPNEASEARHGDDDENSGDTEQLTTNLGKAESSKTAEKRNGHSKNTIKQDLKSKSKLKSSDSEKKSKLSTKKKSKNAKSTVAVSPKSNRRSKLGNKSRTKTKKGDVISGQPVVQTVLNMFSTSPVRSDIADEAEALSNQTINNQGDLATLYHSMEQSKEEEDKKKVALSNKVSESPNTKMEISNKTAAWKTAPKSAPEYSIPKSIPAKCHGLVKAYTDGEVTLQDYLKQIKRCITSEKSAEEYAKASPESRHLVEQATRIQNQAYNFALSAMKNYRPSPQEIAQAETILDNWRANSFGERFDKSAGGVPFAVKKFMLGQTNSPKVAAAKNLNPTDPASTGKLLDPSPSKLLSAVNLATSGATSSPSSNLMLPLQKSSIASTGVPSKTLILSASQSVAPVAVSSSLREAIEAANSLEAPGPYQSSPTDLSSALAAAFDSMGNFGPDPRDPREFALLAGLQKRSISQASNEERIRKESDARDTLPGRVKMVKAIDRSVLGMPLTAIQQGPKILDKIRDMSRVIATP